MKISFCIPTFNRINSLKETINSILENNFKNFEICISDNNSSDGTRDYLRQISSPYIRINYQIENKGIDINMLTVMKMAKGDHVFLLGDDDYLTPGCSKKLNQIIKNDPDLVVFSKKGEKKKFLNEIEKAYEVIWNKMSFGYLMFKKELIEVSFRQEYLGTFHAYSGWVLDGIYHKSKKKDVTILLSSTDIVKTKQVKKNWNSSAFEIYFVAIPKFLSLVLISNGKNIYNNYLFETTKTYFLIQQKALNNLEFQNSFIKKLRKHYSKLNILKMKLLFSFPFNKMYGIFKN